MRKILTLALVCLSAVITSSASVMTGSKVSAISIEDGATYEVLYNADGPLGSISPLAPAAGTCRFNIRNDADAIFPPLLGSAMNIFCIFVPFNNKAL